MSEKLLTFREASNYTGMKLASLYHYADRKYINPVRDPNEKYLRIPVSELNWLISETYPDELKSSIKFIQNHPDRSFSTKEVSELLGISQKMVCMHIKQGNLESLSSTPPYVIPGNSLNNWINDRVHTYSRWVKKSASL